MVEMGEVTNTKLVFEHDWTQLLYCYKINFIVYEKHLKPSARPILGIERLVNRFFTVLLQVVDRFYTVSG